MNSATMSNVGRWYQARNQGLERFLVRPKIGRLKLGLWRTIDGMKSYFESHLPLMSLTCTTYFDWLGMILSSAPLQEKQEKQAQHHCRTTTVCLLTMERASFLKPTWIGGCIIQQSFCISALGLRWTNCTSSSAWSLASGRENARCHEQVPQWI